MSKPRLSLINVLNPPENPWLEEISHRNAKVPAGVRVVRLSDDDEEGDDARNQSSSSRSRLARVATEKAA